MNSLITRTITGILFVIVLVGGIILSPISFAILFALITVLTLLEFASVVNENDGAHINRFINAVAGVILFLAFFAYCSDFTRPKIFIPYLLSIIYLLVSELYLKQKNPLKDWAYAFASQIYVALPFALLNVLAFRLDPIENVVKFEWIFPLSIFIFLWTNDTGAYLVGSMLHKRFPAKLFERISPNKSWVGSIGGGIFCVLAAIVLWCFFPEKQTLPVWIGMSLVICVFGTWGDLIESLLKRQLGIKDSGHILPGHGGMLDRFDSSLLAIPATVLYFYTLEMF